jgi:hypothetical protein
VFRAPETGCFVLTARVTSPATAGLTTLALPPGVHGRIDPASSLSIKLDRGILTSATVLAMHGGANTAGIEIRLGVWEIVQFQTATLVAPQTYQLTNMLRGLRGTEHALIVPTNARFVLLDDAVRSLAIADSDIGLALYWRAGPARKDIGDVAYTTTQQRFTGKGLAPLSPVHIKIAHNATGDIVFNWTRRTRINGDSWETTDVPLGETTESYTLDVLDLGAVKRTITSFTPSALYTTADQLADFGTPQSSLTIRLAQVSPTYGRGTSRTLTL